MPTLTTLAHTVRNELKLHGANISLGLTHQLLAAARGYKTLASLQSSDEPNNLDDSMSWLVDSQQVIDRAASLADPTFNEALFANCLANASRKLHGPRVWHSLVDLEDDLTIEVQDVAAVDDGVGIELADTNCYGPFMAYMNVSLPIEEPLPSSGEEVVIEFEGTVQADADTERPFSGDTVDVQAQARLTMLGRRLFGASVVEITHSGLDWSWATGKETEDDDVPLISLSQALAIELDVTQEEAEQLIDADIQGDTTQSGVPNGFLVNVSNCDAPELLERLRQQHGTLQIWVLGTSFERIRHNPYD